MSEKERQQRLLELKIKEKQLREEGLYEEAAELVKQYLTDSDARNKLLYEEGDHFEQRVQERIARRKQRIDEGNKVTVISSNWDFLAEDVV